MSDQKTPTAPDYSPLISAFNNVSQYASGQGADALNWAKNAIANNTDLTKMVTSGMTGIQGGFGQAATDQLNSGQATAADATNYLRGEREKYADPTRKAADMGAAEASAAQANEAARDASTRELESYGVNPGATRFAALDIPARLQDAATRVGAANVASRTDDALADQANTQLLNQGNTNVTQANQTAGTSLNAGTGAVSTNLANTSTGYQGLGTDLAWTTPQLSGLTGATGAQNTGFNNQASADQISNSSSSGLGSLLGVGASMLGKGGALASGGALAGLFEEGGAVDDAGGGAVPVAASPSRGAVTDDIPAVTPGGPARLNGGEFVLPKDVVSWKGEEFLQKLIAQSRKQKEGASAKPKAGAIPMNPAAMQSRPAQGALPVG